MKTERNRRLTENRLAYYKPYPKQREFHAAGATIRERLLMAGNQVGKTLAGGFEAAMHATGRYPDWWKGQPLRPADGRLGLRRDERSCPRHGAARSGRPAGQRGTGAIPKDALIECVPARGIADALDTIKVQPCISGGTSIIGLKSYSSGREKFQGETLDWVWLDEEPPADIYTEALDAHEHRQAARSG